VINLDKYIFELLLRHDCVIVPGFGAFVSKYQAASIDTHKKTISPPSKKIAFNSSLKSNDALLVHYISSELNCPYVDILVQMDEIVKSWLNKLNEGEKVIIRNVGEFVQGPGNKVLFRRYQSRNYLLDSFGFADINIKEIFRTYSREKRIKTRVKTDTKALYYSVPALVAVFAFIWAFLLTEPAPGSLHTGRFEMPGRKTEKQKVQYQLHEKTPVDKYKERPQREQKTETFNGLRDTGSSDRNQANNDLVIAENQYYVIGAAFREKYRAETYQQELLIKGYTSGIEQSGNGFYCVYYCNFTRRNEALKYLEKIRTEENASAWLLSL
jgi:nucleoid DNA-binding protein